jgi:iron complex transport system ATP-binding protein
MEWNQRLTITGIQKPLSGTIALNGKNIHQIDALTVAQNLSVVLTEKLLQQFNCFELIALGRQPYTNWIGKQQTLILLVNEAMESNQIYHLKNIMKSAMVNCKSISCSLLQEHR